MNDSPVTRTASDALQAKAAAINIAGYRPSVTNAEAYADLLQRLDSTPRRQTPLVHAGYTLRIQAILSSIENFVKTLEDQKAQLIVLGGGMDVTGLWAGTHFSQFSQVIELDLPDVCVEKKRLLQQTRLVEFQDSKETSNTFVGSIQGNCSSQFTLVGKDLRSDGLHWDSILEGLWDSNLPTLIVSEVVLAYLGDDAVDCILSAWAGTLFHSKSCLVLLEPLGHSTSNNPTASNRSVLQDYQMLYTQQFRAKMTKGYKNDDILFTPLGTTAKDVARRMKTAGFHSAVAVSMATATQTCGLKAKEPFDEHAALVLHAQSYVVACAFPPTSTTALFRRIMAPWSSSLTPFRARDQFWIAPADLTQETEIKKLFFDGYAELSSQYKSVNKLMQSTLKKDIQFTKVEPQNEGINFSSHFSEYYEERGGCFVVALDSTKEAIAGFIGLSKASPKEKGILAKYPNTYEIHRLFVVPEYRSQGIAGLLLDAIQTVALSKSPDGTTVTFVASTLDVLPQANKFYQRRDFTFEFEEPLGDVILRHYVQQMKKPTP
jgi:GNAT superfamily N-acetyltransferase/O-methyltransferase involved in polyketide biosynthesis